MDANPFPQRKNLLSLGSGCGPKSQWPIDYQKDQQIIGHEPDIQQSLVIGHSVNILNKETFYIILVEQETSQIV